MKDLFFPRISRRKNYLRKKNGDYYHYKRYQTEIIEDCQKRCVYCDTKLEEMGGEGMELDHFRPQKVFPELKNSPENLVASCPKCNRLKSDHWPCKIYGLCHDVEKGFIDPFEENRLEFFTIERTGILISKRHPALYIQELLLLNRPARIQVRRKRFIDSYRKELIERVERIIKDASVELKQDEVNKHSLNMRLSTLLTLVQEIKNI